MPHLPLNMNSKNGDFINRWWRKIKSSFSNKIFRKIKYFFDWGHYICLIQMTCLFIYLFITQSKEIVYFFCCFFNSFIWKKCNVIHVINHDTRIASAVKRLTFLKRYHKNIFSLKNYKFYNRNRILRMHATNKHHNLAI